MCRSFFLCFPGDYLIIPGERDDLPPLIPPRRKVQRLINRKLPRGPSPRKAGRRFSLGDHRFFHSLRTQCLRSFRTPHPSTSPTPLGKAKQSRFAPSTAFAVPLPQNGAGKLFIHRVRGPPSPFRGRQSNVDSPHPPLPRSPFPGSGKAKVKYYLG